MSKYTPLAQHLKATGQDHVTMPLSAIQSVIQSTLPNGAMTDRTWWGNCLRRAQAKHGWMATGYTVDSVQLVDKVVTFKHNYPTCVTDPL